MLGVVLLAMVVGGAVMVSVAIVRSRRRPVDVVPAVEQLIDPADVAELAARFEGIDAEHARRRATLLEVHLQPLVQRRIPVRSFECLPALRTNRVHFADGTAVNVKGETPGDAGVLASAVLRHAVLPATCSTDARGTHLVFDWSQGRRHLSMLVTGFAQPD